MLIEYGSIMYFAYIFLALFVCLFFYFLLRKRSNIVKKTAVFLIALLNFAQHIFKGQIYPQYQDHFSAHLSSAYNVCAFMILISPFVILFGTQLSKNYVTYLGTFAGMVAMVVPYWFIGKPAFNWDVYRFYICHGLLFVSSILPALLGLHTLQWKHCWKIGLLFFVMLALILLNDALFIRLGLYPVENPDDLFASLSKVNPGWSMRPDAKFAWLVDIIALFTPSFFLGNNPWGVYLPILWYAIPLYFAMTALVCAVCGLTKVVTKSLQK